MTGPNYIVLTTHRSHSLKRETSSPFRTWKGALWNPGIQPPLPSRSLWGLRLSPIIARYVATWSVRSLWLTRAALPALLGTMPPCSLPCRPWMHHTATRFNFFFPSLSFLPFKNKSFQHWKWRARRIKGVVHWKAQKAEELAAHFGENVTKFQGVAIHSSQFKYPRRTSYPARCYWVVSTIMKTQFYLALLKAKKEGTHRRRRYHVCTEGQRRFLYTRLITLLLIPLSCRHTRIVFFFCPKPTEYVIPISNKILGNSKFKLAQGSDVADIFFFSKGNKCRSLFILQCTQPGLYYSFRSEAMFGEK